MAAIVNNHRITYFRVEGERGAYVILYHGLFGSSEDWYKAGYVEKMAPEFRLIVPDGMGHGRSDTPTDRAAYTLPALADDLVAVMDSMGIRNAHFLGYGLGALVGFHLLFHYPERVRVCVLGGESPLVSAEAKATWKTLQIPSEAGGAAISAEQQAAWGALLAAMGEWPENLEAVNPVQSPLIVLAARQDPALERAKKAVRTIPRARFQEFEGTHAGLFAMVTPLFAEFQRMAHPAPRAEPAKEPVQRQEGPLGPHPSWEGWDDLLAPPADPLPDSQVIGKKRSGGNQEDRPQETPRPEPGTGEAGATGGLAGNGEGTKTGD
ncbi:MAG: alpha/beta fold hydrolase [Deltaproteobacteria bacterium]|nr:alpha/beta fold hydrolase [Deltaproteobacteria bacterium]